MPNCFSLTRNGETAPATLTEVDEALCAHLGVPVHPVQWVRGWYDLEGFALAMGRDWDWMRANFDPDRAPIVDFLAANYTPDCWSERGR